MPNVHHSVQSHVNFSFSFFVPSALFCIRIPFPQKTKEHKPGCSPFFGNCVWNKANINYWTWFLFNSTNRFLPFVNFERKQVSTSYQMDGWISGIWKRLSAVGNVPRCIFPGVHSLAMTWRVPRTTSSNSRRWLLLTHLCMCESAHLTPFCNLLHGQSPSRSIVAVVKWTVVMGRQNGGKRSVNLD